MYATYKSDIVETEIRPQLTDKEKQILAAMWDAGYTLDNIAEAMKDSDFTHNNGLTIQEAETIYLYLTI